MQEMTRISIPVTFAEREILRTSAQQHLRHPRDQARYLLRQALGLTSKDEDQPQQMQSHDAMDSDPQRVMA